jgi:hypothetical protein
MANIGEAATDGGSKSAYAAEAASGLPLREAREAQDEARQRRQETRVAALEEAVARLLGPAAGRKAAGC